MFRPGRLLLVALLALGGYGLFFHTPSDPHTIAAFDPQEMAALETSAWQMESQRGEAEFMLFWTSSKMAREQFRYNWWNALWSGFHQGRLATQFSEMANRFERALPDLEAIAVLEQNWTKVNFDPAKAARLRLNWWASRKMPGQDTVENVSTLMAEDYAFRYGVGQDRVAGFASFRTAAMKLRDEGGAKPDWTEVTRILTEAYRSLKAGLTLKR